MLASADDQAKSTLNESGNIAYLTVPRFQSRYCFVCPNPLYTDNVLDCLKVSDTVLILWPLDSQLSNANELLMSTMMAHGLPATLHVVSGLPSNGKLRDHLRKGLGKLLERW
jgi:hypothetical protein